MMFEIEELSLSAWPALQTIAYDGWLLRFAEGYTKRSNSVNPLYPSSLPLDLKNAACEDRYRSRGLPTIFKITEAESQRTIDKVLERLGYERIDETFVMTREPADAGPGPLASAALGSASLSLGSDFDQARIEGFCACGRHEAERSVIERILENLIVPKIVASVAEGDRIVGCGYGALDSGWVGLFDIAVAEDRRRRGYGEALVSSILERAAEEGATRAYLQVVAANEPARRLYAKLGFRDSYLYWYRKKA